MIDPDYFTRYECTFSVINFDTKKILLNETLTAPRIVHEQQFLNLVKQAFNSKHHLEVKISRLCYVEGRDDPLLLDFTYRNWQ